MKAVLDVYIKRLDALTRRERGLILAAVAAILAAVFYVAGIGPALEKSKLLSVRIADQKNQKLVAEVQRTELSKSLNRDPDGALRERIAAKRREIAQIDSQLAGLERSLVPPQSMASVLEQLVGQDRNVRLVRLVNLPATPLVQKEGESTDKAAAAASTPGASGGRHVFKHGVQVKVEGSYLDLLAYVARLEKQPWQVYWGKTAMTADYPKIQIELTLYTLSLDKAWLVV
jgi:MSHA biogenesis protein MshJ